MKTKVFIKGKLCHIFDLVSHWELVKAYALTPEERIAEMQRVINRRLLWQ